MSLGGGEILVVLLVALIVFGPQRMPEIGRQIGKAMRELRKMQDSVREELHGALQLDDHDAAHDAHDAADDASGPPSYGEPQQIAPESERGEPAPMPHPDPPSSGSFSY